MFFGRLVVKEGLVNKRDLVDTIYAHFVSIIGHYGVTLIQLGCACSRQCKTERFRYLGPTHFEVNPTA